MDRKEIETQLTRIAYQKSEPFCYGCYVPAKKDEHGRGRCSRCGSDDLMRLLKSCGCEYGVDWIYPILLKDSLTPVDTEAAFEESIREIYPETVSVGWLELDTVSVIKDQDPVSWRIAVGEWIDNEMADDRLVTFDHGDTYFWTHDVESYIEQEEVL